ncbi:hypothetical protein L204_103865 [Cryptococcus depauperatus]|nr:hypothetical protein L204_03022 [Cryptococcus depauperatus CBS 7855]
MAFEFGPLVIAAIVSAAVAITLILFVVVYRLVRRSKQHSTSSQHSTRATSPLSLGPSVFKETISTPGFSHTATTHLRSQTPIAPSPSTGQTTLVTPNSTASHGKHKMKKIDSKSLGGLLRPESSEMVVITYEEGLRKLGINFDNGSRPHHILYPEYDDTDSTEGFESQSQAVDSPRTRPGRDRIGGKGVPAALESTWLPSYYHTPHGEDDYTLR